MFKSLAVVAAFALIAAFVSVFTGGRTAAVIVTLAVGGGAGVGLFVKDGTNSSLADKLADVYKFSKSRKAYPYVYMDDRN